MWVCKYCQLLLLLLSLFPSSARRLCRSECCCSWIHKLLSQKQTPAFERYDYNDDWRDASKELLSTRTSTTLSTLYVCKVRTYAYECITVSYDNWSNFNTHLHKYTRNILPLAGFIGSIVIGPAEMHKQSCPHNHKQTWTNTCMRCAHNLHTHLRE